MLVQPPEGIRAEVTAVGKRLAAEALKPLQNNEAREAILSAAREIDVEYYITEQDNPNPENPVGDVETALRNAERLADGWPIEFDGDPTTIMGLPMSILPPRLEAFTTAFAGGAALMAGALSPDLATVLSPPVEYLEGKTLSLVLETKPGPKVFAEIMLSVAGAPALNTPESEK